MTPVASCILVPVVRGVAVGADPFWFTAGVSLRSPHRRPNGSCCWDTTGRPPQYVTFSPWVPSRRRPVPWLVIILGGPRQGAQSRFAGDTLGPLFWHFAGTLVRQVAALYAGCVQRETGSPGILAREKALVRGCGAVRGCVQRETGFRTWGSCLVRAAPPCAAWTNQYAAVMMWRRSAGSSNSIRMRALKLVLFPLPVDDLQVAGYRLGRVRDQGFRVEGESGGFH